MAPESENAQLIRGGYEAFNRGDLEAVLELIDPEIVLAVLEESMITDEFRGHDGFRKLLAENGEMFSYHRNQPLEVLELSPEKIVVVVRSAARGRISGVEVEGTVVHVWTLRDRKAIRFEVFPSREAAIAAAS